MNWIQNYNDVYTGGEISSRKVCYGVTCTGYRGCFVDSCICYVAYPCGAKAMP